MASGAEPTESVAAGELRGNIASSTFTEHYGNCGPAHGAAAPGSSPSHRPMRLGIRTVCARVVSPLVWPEQIELRGKRQIKT